MKNFVIVIATLLSASISYANAKVVGNGGDPCENRFQVLRDDLRSWLQSDAPSLLTLPDGVYTHTYQDDMIRVIDSSLISCTDNRILLGDSEKTCANYIDNRGQKQILCNRSRFMTTQVSDQYVLVHHEFAGLANLEVSRGSESVYFISNQLTAYLNAQARLSNMKTVCSITYQDDKDLKLISVGDFDQTSYEREVPGKDRNVSVYYASAEVYVTLGKRNFKLAHLRIPRVFTGPFEARLEYFNLAANFEESLTVKCRNVKANRK